MASRAPLARIVDDETFASLENERGVWQGIALACRGIVIHDDAGMTWATERVRLARNAYDAFDAKREAIRAPLREALAALDALFADPLRATAQVAKDLRTAVAAYVAKGEAERRAGMLASAATVAAGHVPTDVIPPPAATQAAGVSVRSKWVGEVVDENMVERGLCSPDPRKIARVLAAYDPSQTPHAIPGVRVTLQSTATVR